MSAARPTGSTANVLQALSEQKPLSCLEKHVELFVDKEWSYSTKTISDGMHNGIDKQYPSYKAGGISYLNASHANYLGCPAFSGSFAPDKSTKFAYMLHAGTTRIFNADGSINEDRWLQLIKIAEIHPETKQSIVRHSTLKTYVAECNKNDPCDYQTGRHGQVLLPHALQFNANLAAWDDVFRILSCGWMKKNDKHDEYESYLTLDILREFFENSKKVFERVQKGELPAPCPTVEATSPKLI